MTFCPVYFYSMPFLFLDGFWKSFPNCSVAAHWKMLTLQYASMAPVVRNLWSAYTVAVKKIYQKTGYYVYYQLYCVYSS